MHDDSKAKPQPQGQTKKRDLIWIIGGCTAVAALIALAYVLTIPLTPAGAAEQYIEDHYDAVAEAVVHTAFPDNPLKAEIIAEVAESIAEQVIPYNCQATDETENTVEARCNLSFSLEQPLELRIDAPFRVSMSTINRDVFGKTTPLVQDSNPIISEMTVNGINLGKLKEAQTAAEEVKESLGNVGSEIEDLLDR